MTPKPNLPTDLTPSPAHNLTPKEKEIQSLFARGKSPEIIAIRMGMKISKVMMAIAMMPKLLV
jgi:DNA-binding CsgD family transcriptional regulator